VLMSPAAPGLNCIITEWLRPRVVASYPGLLRIIGTFLGIIGMFWSIIGRFWVN